MQNPIQAILVVIATIAFVAAPAFTDPFFGYTTEQLPYAIPAPPIQPAGYAFSIWGVIYLWLLISAGFGLFLRRNDPAWQRTRLALTASVGLGVFWLWIAGQSAIWGTVTIILMLVTALIAFLRAPGHDRWWLKAPLALYSGWLSAASLVSFTITLAGFGIAFGWVAWAIIGIIIAAALGIAVQRQAPKVPEYSISIIWALIGIVVANQTNSTAVAVLAAITAAVVAGHVILAAIRA